MIFRSYHFFLATATACLVLVGDKASFVAASTAASEYDNDIQAAALVKGHIADIEAAFAAAYDSDIEEAYDANGNGGVDGKSYGSLRGSSRSLQTSCPSTRCGTTWSDANGKCGLECWAWTSDPNWYNPCLAIGEDCFANLNTALGCCSSPVPAPAPAPVAPAPAPIPALSSTTAYEPRPGMAQCPPGQEITTPEECAAAGFVVGGNFRLTGGNDPYVETENWGHTPCGCFLWGAASNSGDIHFDTGGSSGCTASIDGKPVCKTSLDITSDYHMLSAWTEKCPPGEEVTSAEECAAAGFAVGGNFRRTSGHSGNQNDPYVETHDWGHTPCGCFLWGTDIHFDTSTTNCVRSEHGRPICRSTVPAPVAPAPVAPAPVGSYCSWSGNCPVGGGDPNVGSCNDSEAQCVACGGAVYCLESAPVTPTTTYQKLPDGLSRCPDGTDITTVDECMTAGLQLGGDLYNGAVVTGTWGHTPCGCFIGGGSAGNVIHFDSTFHDCNGGSTDWYQPVCHIPAPVLPSPASGGLPSKVLGGYLRVSQWGGPGPVAVNLNPPDANLLKYNVIILFKAQPRSYSCPTADGAAGWNSDGNCQLDFFSCDPLSQYPNLYENIQNLRRNYNKKVILSVGGAGGQMHFNGDVPRDKAHNELTYLINSIGGVDGIDWNTFEGITLSDTEIDRMIWISQMLRNDFGSDFIITMPPSVTYDRQTHERNVASRFKYAGVLDMAFPQFYDGSGNDLVSTFDARRAQWVTNGPLDASDFGFAMDFGYSTTTLTEAGAVGVWNNHNDLRGVVKFDIGKDKQNNWEFTNRMYDAMF